MSNDLRNATASWSWYLHQWKVGIFVALKEIVRLLDEWKSIENWRIIYENAEDFDIQENDWTDFIVKSRHQVKANKNTNNRKSHYTTAINKFDINNIDSNTKCRLHVIEEINDWYTSGASINSNKQIVEPYEYETWQKYCDLSLGDNYLKDESLKFIKKIRDDVDDEIYLEILFKLDEEIRKEHLKNTIWTPKLTFSEIHKSIIDYITFENKDESRLRESFSDYWTEFKNTIPPNIKKEQIILLDEYMSNIYEKDYLWFKEDLKIIHFYDDFEKNKNIEKTSFKNVIVKFLYNSSLNNKNKLDIFLRENNYILTSCSYENDEKIIPIYNLIENISKWNLKLNFFSWKSLINKEIDYKLEKFVDINESIDKNKYTLDKVADIEINRNNWISLISKDKI